MAVELYRLNLLEITDIFFFVFHTSLILFNTFGYLFRRTRVYNLATLLITAIFWFGLGIWYGWGYCWFTDLHWQVRDLLGYNDKTNSYIDLLIMKITGLEFQDKMIDTVTVTVFAISLLLSTILNIRDRRRAI